ncbi:MAG TPA: type I pullulanase [Armatimonadota bacterium]|jgi:pullulanase
MKSVVCSLACAIVAAPFAQGAAVAAEPWSGPAFLDKFDEITVWIPQAAKVGDVAGRIRVRVAGKEAAVKEVVGAQKAGTGRDPNKVVVVGTIQAALGGTEWDPTGATGGMFHSSDNVFELVVKLRAGHYEYKVARGGSWDENYGAGFADHGANIPIDVPSERIVRFVVDFEHRTIRDSINNPAEVAAPDSLPVLINVPASAQEAAYESFHVILADPLKPQDVAETMTVQVGDDPVRPVFAREVLSNPIFDYRGTDLGSRWSAACTTFKVWSPVSKRADLLLFGSAKSPTARTIAMKRSPACVWYATVRGDLHGAYYQYSFESRGGERIAADINGYAASPDAKRSIVVDLSRTNPPGWPGKRPFAGRKATDAVVYEVHVRDYTIDPQSGVKPEWRGKYLGMVEKGSRIPGTAFPTGLDYLKGLGVTHVQILPMQDFNPAHSEMYGWGYETTLFNVPEEQYAVRREDPLAAIREAKSMFIGFHRAGLGAIMDVVYNHTVPSEGDQSAFWQTVPYYYFRTNDRGDVLNESGVGNAMNDDHPMVRKFVRDSLVYWAREYRVDGFRFDLLGMFTPETVRDLAKAIRAVNPDAVITGEPWTGGGPTRFGKGAQRGTPVAVFNDNFRGTVRGELDGPAPGFAMGGPVNRRSLENAVTGAIDDFADAPAESLNYVSAHDNMTFRDKVALSMPDADAGTRESAVRLAYAAVLLSQGIPFLEGGVEIGRTKRMSNNSYNGGDALNRYDWSRAPEYAEMHDYLRGLIALRRAHPAFRLWSKTQVKTALTFLPVETTPPGTVAFRLDGSKVGDPWKEILVVLHGSRQRDDIELPSGQWSVALGGSGAGSGQPGSVQGKLKLEPLTAYVLQR